MKIKAIIFGATGMVGEGVLFNALNNSDVEEVLLISRKPTYMKNPKIKEILLDNFYDYSTIENIISGYNACYFCLGVSSLAVSKEDYVRITYNLTMSAAKVLAKSNPDMTFCYVSGSGTDSSEKGKVRWARVKGKTENDLLKLPFKSVYLFRPGFIKPISGLRHAYTASKILGTIYPLLNVFLKKYICTLQALGDAMIQVTGRGYHKPVLENIDITALAKSAK